MFVCGLHLCSKVMTTSQKLVGHVSSLLCIFNKTIVDVDDFDKKELFLFVNYNYTSLSSSINWTSQIFFLDNQKCRHHCI